MRPLRAEMNELIYCKLYRNKHIVSPVLAEEVGLHAWARLGSREWNPYLKAAFVAACSMMLRVIIAMGERGVVETSGSRAASCLTISNANIRSVVKFSELG